jgi:hypothetical protein
MGTSQAIADARALPLLLLLAVSCRVMLGS